ncbi:sugar ABC transporter substrate-binding protein [Herbiconiux sp. VKM Ac-1786]|uniref:ABC transporter substrate-binding protein n=1 Tax=Herbiconiux sp. VKM Ac-1786 TaxID=2783824 RepID=UPI00188BD073|nr:sugar ABC transporter substrate-binding protein [Herbiconiux sp. VKM Ac-1786]MBF4574521.1 sugar ABC transporter substrate-binding protein [Herbiconiux sp. VKM Ac-1786]
MILHKRARRSILAVVAGTALVAGIAACSSDTSGSSSTDGAATLSLAIWDPAQKAGVQKAVDGFEAENPDIKVNLEQLPEDQYYTKLDASLGAGEGPDVMWQSSKAPVYIEGGAIEPLDEYIEKDGVSLDAYPKKLVDLYNIDGKQYGMPKDQDVWSVVYNTDVFNKLGVTDLPTTDWTWDDMVRIAGEVKEKQTAPTDYPMFYTYTFNNGVASIIHQLGGTVVEDQKGTVSSPEATEALEKIKSLQDDGLIPAVADSTDFNAASSLTSGTIAMAKIPSYQLSLLSKADLPAGTLHVVPQPAINDSHATDTNGLSYVMNANSKQKDAAWKLIKFLTSDEGAKLHVEGGASPAANVAPDVQAAYYEANSSLEGLEDAFKPMMSESYLRTTTQFPPTRANFPQIESAVGDYYAGNISAEDVEAKIDTLLTDSFK